MFGNYPCEVEDLLRFRNWNPFKTRNLWQGINYLELVPVHRLEWQEDTEQNRVVVLVPRYRDFLFGRLVQPRLGPSKRFLRVPLEQRGSFLWREMDGKRTVAELSQAFAVGFPADDSQYNERVSVYLHAMYENGFISYLNFSQLSKA